jgi:hypothetical protein
VKFLDLKCSNALSELRTVLDLQSFAVSARLNRRHHPHPNPPPSRGRGLQERGLDAFL